MADDQTNVLAELFTRYPDLKTAAEAALKPVEKAPGILSRLFSKAGGYFRMSSWGMVAVALAVLVFMTMPQEIGVAHWKLALLSVAAYLGYWVDRAAFPYARPHKFVADDTDWVWTKDDPQGHVFVGLMMRRSLLIAATMIAVAVAL